MSYDIYLCSVDGEPLVLDKPHHLRGGTYAANGTTSLHLNVTYNYAKFFYNKLGDGGIRSIYGKTGREAVPLLQAAVDSMKTDTSENYWDATEGNARLALINLIKLANLAPDGVFDGD